jgi:hypothetical protein
MEAAAVSLREAIRLADPKQLIAYLWFQLWRLPDDRGRDYSEIQHVVLALEYVHAVHAAGLGNDADSTDESLFGEVLKSAERLIEIAMVYAMVSTRRGEVEFRGSDAAEMIYSAKASWILLRGNRYIPLEAEFYAYALAPHNDVLTEMYGVSAEEVGTAIQRAAVAMTQYAIVAPPVIEEHMHAVEALIGKEGIGEKEALKRISDESPEIHKRSSSAMRDLLFGEHCNFSKHSGLPAVLLDDLSFEPGGNTAFFEAGDLSGTPLRTLPARIRPLIHLRDGYYATDPSFVRDSTYRAIQRGVIRRRPEYREEWNRRQRKLSESAFPDIFQNQLHGAQIDQECFYPGPLKGEWSEIDTLVTLEDVLVHIEAKAGISALVSPETNFDSHLKAIDRLVGEAYDQCSRFLEYLDSADEVPIFRRTAEGYQEIRRLRLDAYRVAIPIGLTMESFTPFSSMSKELLEIRPILGRHAFVSLAIDDLLALRRFLPTTGALFHYLEVRQSSASIRHVFVHDEMDHLGSYLKHNRYDKEQLDQLGSKGKRKADFLVWDGYSSEIDKYFGHSDFERRRPPSQAIPPPFQKLLDLIAVTRRPGWIRADSMLRNLSGASRESFSQKFDDAVEALKAVRVRAYHVPDTSIPLTLVFARSANQIADDRLIAIGQAAALAFRRMQQTVVAVRVDESGNWNEAYMLEADAPSEHSPDFGAARTHAQKILDGIRSRPKSAVSSPKGKTVSAMKEKIGRNEPCWCGSGEKFKRCHGGA